MASRNNRHDNGTSSIQRRVLPITERQVGASAMVINYLGFDLRPAGAWCEADDLATSGSIADAEAPRGRWAPINRPHACIPFCCLVCCASHRGRDETNTQQLLDLLLLRISPHLHPSAPSRAGSLDGTSSAPPPITSFKMRLSAVCETVFVRPVRTLCLLPRFLIVNTVPLPLRAFTDTLHLEPFPFSIASQSHSKRTAAGLATVPKNVIKLSHTSPHSPKCRADVGCCHRSPG